MAGINPLQLPKWETAPQIDWSPLARIGNAIGEYRRDQRVNTTIEEARAAGKPLDQVGIDVMMAGDRDTGMAIWRAGMAQAERAADNARADRAAASLDAYRRQSLDLQRRAYEEGKLPQGFRRGADGGLEAIPGGPADPEYLRRRGGVTEVPAGFEAAPGGGVRPIPGGPADPAYLGAKSEATTKPRQLSMSDITKLDEEGGKFQNLSGFADTFKPEYAGYGASWIGDAANAAGRYLPQGVVGKTAAEGASWWQNYDRYKNVVRNELFGSALTATEKSAFERADINPGMTPDQITRNLRRQREIATNGLRRKANAMIAAGYDPDVIGKAYGLDLGSIGVKDQGRVRPGVTAPAAPSKVTNSTEANDAIAAAREAIAQGAPRDQVIKRLRDMGVPVGGL
ncbi:hypothetical protein GJ689_24975 [Rhodoplanes serenus]|uniref:Uncharacterized protein n=1 Tax=Rhodoplanes serenus TaxID=200615 RepID=A0A9X4XRW6_9BRAD|nr:hypothetical protein [Rhodoplanes serenus]MTW19449.1 hypothetical protein [Rhodoplanes serenus]